MLLKNDKGTLPLKPGLKLALVGPHVDGHVVFMSNYHGDRCVGGGFDCIPSPAQALGALNAGGSTSSVKGVDVAGAKLNNISAAVAAAQAADAVVLLVGNAAGRMCPPPCWTTAVVPCARLVARGSGRS